MYFVGVSDVPEETTLHRPFTHPHLPAPQSIGPWQTSVHSRVQTPLFALLIQLVGWQHSAGTQSSSVMHTCDSGDVVTMVVIVVESGEVGVGGTVTGGVFEVHPLTMTSPATISKRTSKPA
jgi:hypothetical protein